MFYLKTLGSLSLYRTDQPDGPVIGGSKPLMLLAVLATTSDYSSTREHLAGLLWPDADHVRSRRSLRQALFNISKLAGQEIIRSDETHSTLSLEPALLSVDLWEFHAALKDEDYERAIELYDGPFLKGFERKAGREVEHQIEAENSRIGVGLEVAYTKLVSRALAREDFEHAVRWAKEFVDFNPLDDRAQATLVRALKTSGDEVGALAAYQAYRTLLQQTLEEEPDADLQEAMERVREEVLTRSATVEEEEEESEDFEEIAADTGAEGEADDEAPAEREAAAVAEDAVSETTSPDAVAGREGRRQRQRPVRATLARRVVTTVVLGIGVPAVVLGIGATAWNLWTLQRTAPAELEEPVFAVIGAETGGQITRITSNGAELKLEPTGHGAGERPSPDGSRIAYNVRAADGWNLALRRASGEDSLTLTTRAGDEFPEGWSPDGRYLLYWETTLLADGRDRTHRLMVWDTRAGGSRPISRLESSTVPSAAWSPDGTRIALTADVDGQPDVFVVDFDGSDLINVSQHRARDLNPAWAPDGSRLAFVSERDGTAQIYSVRRDGSDPQRLTDTDGPVQTPVWTSPTVLLFVLETENGHDLWAADVTSGEVRRLTRRGDVSSLVVNVRVPERRAWIEGVSIVPPARAVSPGQYLQIAAVVVAASGDTLPRGAVRIDWSIGDSTIIEPDPYGYRVVGPGRTTLSASAAGWRADTLHVVSLPLVERQAGLLLEEKWTDSLDAGRWLVFGEPAPSTRPEGGPEDGGVLLNNGDAHFESGVVSREVFDLRQGLGIEVYGRMPFTRRLFQTFAIALYPESPADSADWLATTPLLELVLSGPSANEPAVARVSAQTWNSQLPFPPQPGAWHRYLLQITPEGVVEVIIDDRLYWRSNWRMALDSLGTGRVALGYQSFGTEIAHGPLRVYRPPPLLFVAAEPAAEVTTGTDGG